MVDCMLEHNGIELLVHRLTSLSESASDDEGKAVFNTLSIFENMIEVKPEVRFRGSQHSDWLYSQSRIGDRSNTI